LPASIRSLTVPATSSIGTSGRPGAGSRGRCGRCAAGAGVFHRPADAVGTAAQPARLDPFSAKANPNLVAIFTWSRIGSSASPTMSSLAERAVHLGGVEERDAEVGRAPDQRDRVFPRRPPAGRTRRSGSCSRSRSPRRSGRRRGCVASWVSFRGRSCPVRSPWVGGFVSGGCCLRGFRSPHAWRVTPPGRELPARAGWRSNWPAGSTPPRPRWRLGGVGVQPQAGRP
jgi:hypothetical protein